ncbi:hemolysin [Flavobacterium cyanobacteriorum]|uniref:Hemolysin n=1 Tax=Flavobacterium cyanobacteriorum TaxID=2022802 RepID=A0A255YYS0_9FLAO|nr:hemolysin family protein [Flavobacterium cyanobacteriorum]OYQ34387.1 hemolysin [Flavobacterium cyanobacteriorum]
METAIIIVCLLLSAFFSGMEIAYVSSNKVYLGVEKKQSAFLSRVLSRLTADPTRFIAAMLVCNSIVLVIYSYYMGNAIMYQLTQAGLVLLPFYTEIVQVFIATFVLLLTAEFLPKVFFQVYANRLLKVLAVPAYFFCWLFSLPAKAMLSITDFILIKIFRTRGDRPHAYFSMNELGNYISEQMSGVSPREEVDSEIQIFRNALEFSDMKARNIMTPRTEIAAVEINDSVAGLKQLFITTGYSKIIVYKDTLDNVVGYIHSFDLFKKPGTIGSVMIPIEYAPETILIKELLNILTRKRKSMAVILDEYGGTSGIVTVEDIIEELFGEIEDEHDEDEVFMAQDLGNGAYLFSARLDVEYINKMYGLSIPGHDAYSTLGGFIVYYNGDIPNTGEKIICNGFDIIIEQATNKRIERVRIAPAAQK